MSDELRFSVLAGLPAEGPLALQFSATGQGLHSEGYVVRFMPEGLPAWTGNFQPGDNSFYCVIQVFESNQFIVIAGGQGYVIDQSSGALERYILEGIEFIYQLPDSGNILVSNGLWFRLYRGDATLWCSRRLSWDGMRGIEVCAADGVITGDAWHYDQTWHPFEVDLESGDVRGGAY